MAFEPYPRHVHGPNRTHLVVNSDEERDAAVLAGWYLWPKDVPDADLGQSQAHEAPVSGENDAAIAAPADDAIAVDLSHLNAKQALEHIAICDAPATLTTWASAEADGKARRSVLAAIDARLADLAEA